MAMRPMGRVVFEEKKAKGALFNMKMLEKQAFRLLICFEYLLKTY